MSDHSHRGEYADDRHDHDLDYAEKHHRHYDDERAVGELQREVRELGAALAVYARDLSEALGRIRQLEDRVQDEPADESWQSTLADYQVASGAAEYDDEDEDDDPQEAGEQPFAAVPRLRRVTCTRTVMVDGNPEPCGLPVDHDPDEVCPGNPHARPAPEASQP